LSITEQRAVGFIPAWSLAFLHKEIFVIWYSQDWSYGKGLFQYLKSILLLNVPIPGTILFGQVREWL